MALTCNIDRRGKLARLIYGVILLLAGLGLAIFWAWPHPSLLRWAVAIACAGGGVFAIFEALVGWCAIRAMGFKTPM